jgi:hypothetical protein
LEAKTGPPAALGLELHPVLVVVAVVFSEAVPAHPPQLVEDLVVLGQLEIQEVSEALTTPVVVSLATRLVVAALVAQLALLQVASAQVVVGLEVARLVRLALPALPVLVVEQELLFNRPFLPQMVLVAPPSALLLRRMATPM